MANFLKVLTLIWFPWWDYTHSLICTQIFRYMYACTSYGRCFYPDKILLLSVAVINTTIRNNLGMKGSISSSASVLPLLAKAGASAAQESRVRIRSRGHGGTCLLTCFPWPFHFTLLSNQGPPAEGWHCPPMSFTNQWHALFLCLQASLTETIFNASSFFADDSNVCQIDKT